MKTILKYVAIYGLSLYLIDLTVNGVTVSGGFATYALSGLLLAVMHKLLKPIINILSMPLQFLSFGLFSIFTNTILLYLLTVFVPNVKIQPFTFTGASLVGFIIPRISFNAFFAYVVAAVVLSIISSGIFWLIKK